MYFLASTVDAIAHPTLATLADTIAAAEGARHWINPPYSPYSNRPFIRT